MCCVPMLLREWREGLGGLPSVDELNARWGVRWRSISDRQWYSSRKLIVDEIRRLVIVSKDSEKEVVKAIEADRLRKGWSLDKLFKSIKAATKERAEDEGADQESG